MRAASLIQRVRGMQSSVPRVTRVVSIDAMNTLIAPKELPAKTYCDFAEKQGIPCDQSKLETAFVKALHDQSLKHPCFGNNSLGALNWWSEVVVTSIRKAAVSKFDENSAQLTANLLFEHFADGNAWKIIDPEIFNVLTQLRQRGFSLAVVSNFDFRLRTILNQLKLAPHFDVIITSGEIGYEKPDPKIFNVLVKHFDLINPTEFLHIGDSVRKDYLGARDYGARALLFDPNLKEPSVSIENKLMSFKNLDIY